MLALMYAAQRKRVKTGACLNECAVKLRFSAVLLYTGAAYSSIQSVDEKGNSTKGRCKGGNIG